MTTKKAAAEVNIQRYSKSCKDKQNKKNEIHHITSHHKQNLVERRTLSHIFWNNYNSYRYVQPITIQLSPTELLKYIVIISQFISFSSRVNWKCWNFYENWNCLKVTRPRYPSINHKCTTIIYISTCTTKIWTKLDFVIRLITGTLVLRQITWK